MVHGAADGSTARTAVVAQEITQAMALKGRIETASSGRILRYKVTAAGREQVRGMLEREEGRALAEMPGMADAAASFDGAPQVFGARRADDERGGSRRMRYNLAESPLTILARRHDKSGAPFLSDDLVRAGERPREDFQLAQMAARAAPDWEWLVSNGAAQAPRGPSPRVFVFRALRKALLWQLQSRTRSA